MNNITIKNTYKYLMILLLSISCSTENNQRKSQNIESVEKKEIVTSIQKDTLFSIITSDLTFGEGFDLLFKLANDKNSNFELDRREYYKSSPFKPTEYYNEPVYIMVFNGKSYMFDIYFNSYGWRTPSYIYDILKLTPEAEGGKLIDIVALGHKTKDDERLIQHLLTIFNNRYGAYEKNTQKYYNYGLGAFSLFDTDKLASISTVDYYTWINAPKVLIKQNTTYHIACINFPEKIPYYSYTTTLIYHSDRFLHNYQIWKVNNELENKEKELEFIRKGERQLNDLF